jgi:hypothetical protein
MLKKILITLLTIYLIGAFVDYLDREGIKNGLWNNLIWRDGALPLVSLAKGLLWPIHLISNAQPTKIYSQSTKTTAMQFVEILHNANKYPLCSSNGCIQDITAKDNTVIATYILPNIFIELPKNLTANSATTAEKMRPSVLREICAEIQPDFPDKSMKWKSDYYSSDHQFVASILMTLDECPVHGAQ